MKFKSDIEVQAGLKDSAGGSGTSGQVLSTTGTSVSWVDPSTLPAVSAKNLITEVWNETGETLTKGTVVYINNGHGNLPTITKALATSDATSAQTYGVVQADITNNNNGWVVVIGILIDLDTQIYAAGTQLYLSSTAAGAWTSTKQYAPAHLVYVGIVVRSHPTQGVVEIKIQNGYEMDELHNVSAQSPNNNAILQYKTSTSLWTSVDGTTSNIAEGSNLYYLDSRARAALSFTAGSGAYNSTTGVITIPTNTNQLTNGSNFITLASLSGTAPIGYNNATGIISITQAGTSSNGYLSSTDWTTFNNKQNALTNPVTGTGNAGYIPKFTAGTTIGNSSIYENSGNVGIGTTSPSYKLTVRNDVAASTSLDQASIGLYNNSDGGSAIYFSNAVGGQSKLSFGVESTGAGSDDTYLGFSTGANTSLSEHMRITSGGNVGIGTTSPASKLNVSGDNITVSAGYGIAYAGDQTRIFTPEDNVSGGLLNWGSGGILRFKSGTSERMRIDGSGNVGIGTTSPASIGGFTTLAVNGSTGGLFDLMSGGTTYGRFYSLTNNLIVEAVGTSNIQFAANATERMRITSGGNVGIGTTSPTRKLSIQDTSFLTAFFGSSFVSGTKYYSSVLVGYQDTVVNRSAQFGYTYDSVTEANSFAHITPFGSSEGSVFMVRADGRVGIGTTSASEKLTVQDSGAGSLLRLNNTAATWSSTMVYGTTTATSGGFDFIGMYANGAAKFNVSSTGVVTASGGFFNSDIRLKNLIDYKYNVESIKPITYIWKDSEDKKRKIGYSAQEVQKILPEAVKEDKEGFLSVDYIQILVAKIAELENRIKQLEK